MAKKVLEKKKAKRSEKARQKDLNPFWLSFTAVLAVITLVIIFQEPGHGPDFRIERALTALEISEEESIAGNAANPCAFYKKKVNLYRGHRDRYCGLNNQNSRYELYCVRYNEAYQEYKILSHKYCTAYSCKEGSYVFSEEGDLLKCVNTTLIPARCE